MIIQNKNIFENVFRITVPSVRESELSGTFCNYMYCKISNTRHTKSPNLNVSCLVLQLSAQSNEARCYVENEDLVGSAPTGDAPTTSEWSTILLPNKVHLILEIWRYMEPV